MNTQLRELQSTLLGILRDIDDFCKKENIQYSLYGGTLIGAVRHKGFIPWDDDLDICMTRENYNKFIERWETINPPGYILQNKENTPSFTQSFTKIRKEHTTFLQEVDKPLEYHTGIFVDIFPFDRIPSGIIYRRWFQIRCILYQLLVKEYIPPKANFVGRILTKIVFFLYPKGRRQCKREELLRWIVKHNLNPKNERISIEGMKTIFTPFPSDFMDEYVFLQFEDKEYMCLKQYDLLLRAFFGDYMQLPPVEERTSLHDAKIIDFNYSYEELCNKGLISIDSVRT